MFLAVQKNNALIDSSQLFLGMLLMPSFSFLVVQYTLTVSVSDGKYFATTKVKIAVKNVADEPPKFVSSEYRVTIAENTTALPYELLSVSTLPFLSSPPGPFFHFPAPLVFAQRVAFIYERWRGRERRKNL
jgi:hypothetical protein